MSAQLLPTRELAFAGYPERDLARDVPAWDAAAQHIRARLTPPRASVLPPNVAKGLAAARLRLHAMNAAELARAVPKLRATIRKAGLKGSAAGWALALTEHMSTHKLGLAPYPSQLLAAWIMLDGRFAEMATGEGKTLASGLAAAAAALAGVPVHLLTANDYLVQRDRERLAPLYDALGLSSACVLPKLSRAERTQAYRSDIVHLTARELAFDYLRDHILLKGVRDPRVLNALSITDPDSPPLTTGFGELQAMFGIGVASEPMGLDVVADEVTTPSTPSTPALPTPAAATMTAAPVLPGLCFAILDEADSILLDEAAVPLILAAPFDALEGQSCRRALAMARMLRRERDYTLDAPARRCALNDAGRQAVTQVIEASEEPPGLLRPLRRAFDLVAAGLSALHALHRDRDYLVSEGAQPSECKLQLIDEVTGRIAEGRQWTGPLQMMVELKEGLVPSPSTRVSAQITYQRFFPRYLRLGGMSGTLVEDRHELHAQYDVHIELVALNQTSRRVWTGERLFTTTPARDAALTQRVLELSRAGRPVLVGTDSVAASQRISAQLHAAGVDNQVLNATQDADEARLIARAGVAGVVTVSTNIAGRGTDITLDANARAAGGLHVIATMKNRARRIDRQLIGRAARQGDPGSAEALLALDEGLYRALVSARVATLMQRLAQDGVVPPSLALPLSRGVQRRAEQRDRQTRDQLRRADRANEENFAFAGVNE